MEQAGVGGERQFVVGGLYRHWKKGNLYRALGVAQGTTPGVDYDRRYAVYQGVLDGHWYVRPLDEFLGDFLQDGRMRPRFAEELNGPE